MPKKKTLSRTPLGIDPSEDVCVYNTRHFPVALKDRLRLWAILNDCTIEYALNKVVAAGLDNLENRKPAPQEE